MGWPRLLLIALAPTVHATRSSRAPAREHEANLLADRHEATAGHHVGVGKHTDTISPALEPESDRHFFRKDYPDDFRPYPTSDHLKKFDHPYPVVEDHETYDKDFVKDENNDNGEWQAQMDYDILRNKLRGKQNEVNEAYRREQEDKRHLDSLEEEELSAQSAARRAKSQADEAYNEAEHAHETEEHLGSDIGGAVDEVKEKMKHLEDCQKQLADAKAKLQHLMKAKEERAKNVTEANEAAQKAAEDEKAKVNAHNEKADAELKAAIANGTAKIEDAKSEAKNEGEKLDEEERKLEKEIAEAEAAHESALAEYNKEKEDMDKVHDRLKTAAEKLRTLRNDVDEEGGIYRHKPPSRSGSAVHAPLIGAAFWAALLASASAL